MLKTFLKKIIHSLGYEIHPKSYSPAKNSSPQHLEDTMPRAIKRSKNWNIHPNTVFDVGAAAGSWTKNALKHWPNADYVLFEPLLEREANLNQLKQENASVNIHVLHKLVGENAQEVMLNVSDDLDGSGVYAQPGENTRNVESIPIDEVVQSLKCSPPFVIKLDTHGYEVPILKGAKETLKNTELLIIEVYGFHVSPTAILFWELCQYLDELGFRPVDIVDTLRRKTDEAFWQCDMCFIPKKSPVFDTNTYQ